MLRQPRLSYLCAILSNPPRYEETAHTHVLSAKLTLSLSLLSDCKGEFASTSDSQAYTMYTRDIQVFMTQLQKPVLFFGFGCFEPVKKSALGTVDKWLFLIKADLSHSEKCRVWQRSPLFYGDCCCFESISFFPPAKTLD